MSTIYDFPQIYERVGMKLGHFGCIMLDVEPVPVSTYLGRGDWFYHSDDELLRYVKGPVAEGTAHATLLYGLTPDDNAGIDQRESVDELLAGIDLSTVTVDHVGHFPGQFGKPYSCVVAHLVPDAALLEANRRLRFLPHIDTFAEYRAHVTLAYVHEERTAAAVSMLNDALAGTSLRSIGINYGGELAENRCVHCGRPIAGAEYPTHTAGGYRYKQRCDPKDTGKPYGLAAHRPGTACHELCSGTEEHA